MLAPGEVAGAGVVAALLPGELGVLAAQPASARIVAQTEPVMAIAAVARRHEATLLACDVDLDRVARVIGVELDEAARPERPSR